MDRLDAIKLFVRVVECGSFSAAAREAGIGQPAVSKQIASLEEHLGAQLVQRTSRNIKITQAGRTFYESATRLVDDLEAAEALVGTKQTSPSGLVRMSTAPVFGRLYVVPLLQRFLAQFPDVSVELSASERHTDLIAEGLDLAIRHGQMADSSLIARTIASSRSVTVATPAYFRERGEPKRPSDLGGHACVAYAPMRETRSWSFKGSDGTPGVHHPIGCFRTADAELVRAAVVAGLGIAQAPGWLFAKEIESGAVLTVLEAFQPDSSPISLVHPAGRRVAAKVRVLMDFLAEELPEDDFIR